MTQEDKELLLKDLCSRLPYRVICHIEIHHVFSGYVEKGDLTLNSISIKDSKCDFITCWGIDIDYVRPYLRPMSSMTEEEKIEYEHIAPGIEIENGVRIPNVHQIEWLNAHHFDYRGLIEKGLAIEVTKENNPYDK